ncbi:MAG TPA: CDP-glycerol glycerophosphotransferase family protein [Vicinamibacterales bacterium]|nr:CDP-glycerol glycerophosphotransferase family protein [Vicinamibacterales bacterium]
MKILVSIPHGASAGNVLRSGVIGHVLDAQPAAQVVIASPLSTDAAFVAEFTRDRVRFESLPPHRPNGLEGRLLALVQAAYIDSAVTESVRIRRQEAAAKNTIRWIRAKRLFASAVAPSMVRPSTRYDLSDRFVVHPEAEALFDGHRPDLYIASSPGLIFAEVPLLRTAVRRRVRSMAVDPSWDNFTNKLLPVRHVDRLIVWNDLMRDQAIAFHGYQPGGVRVTGAPHWDLYFRPGTTGTRQAFCRQIGAEPSRKIVTLTTTPQELYRHHARVLRVLVAGMQSGAWPDVQILVRLHPRDDIRGYDEFRGVPGVIIEKPFRPTAPAGDGLAIDMTAESQRHLADTLRHSDVIVNVASTIAIEAGIFDTPVVNVSFDGEAPSEFARSARRYYRFTHYVNVTRHDAVRVAETPVQLVDHIAHYLADPSLDREGRRRVVAEQCQFTDGRSAERAAQAILDELADVTRTTPPCVESLVSSR